MQLKRLLIPLVAIVCLLGSVAIAQAFGLWQTTGTPLTTLTSATIEDIKGSSTLEQVATAFGIPQATLVSLLGLPADIPASSKLKDLEEYNDVTTVRELVAAYLGTPTAPASPGAASTSVTPGLTPTAPSAAKATVAPGQTLPASDIKGTMTLQQVSEQCGIPLDVLYKELGLKADTPAASVLKDLVAAGGPETTRVRDIVAAYQAKVK